MVRWDQLTVPKEHGGLGFTNTKLRNERLLAKWIVGGRMRCAATYLEESTSRTKVFSRVNMR